MMPSPRSLRAAAAGVARTLLNGPAADPRPIPVQMIDEGPGWSVHRYRPPRGVVPAGPPVLFVPPPVTPAGPEHPGDARGGRELAEHVVGAGRLSYRLDHGPIGGSAPDLEVEDSIGQVLPGAIRKVSQDAGGQPVQLVGWCAGGMLALLAAAADPGLPIASVAVLGTPAGAGAAGLAAPLRPLAGVTRGIETDAVAFVLGRVPGPVLKRVFRLTGIDKFLPRSHKIAAALDNAGCPVRPAADDHFMKAAPGHPGRAVRQIHQTLLRGGGRSDDGIDIGGRRVDLARVRVPVLAIAGQGDDLALPAAVRPLTRLLTGAPQVRFEIAPGRRLGVLIGRSAGAETWRHLDRWLDEGTVRHGIRPHRREARHSLGHITV